ncbi:MAG: M15 family metallopeptidase, partial [Armatimonadota bacterium]
MTVVSYTLQGSAYLRQPPHASARSPARDTLPEDIADAAAGADFLIVVLNTPFLRLVPMPIAKTAIDAGADMVICRDTCLPGIQMHRDAPIMRGWLPANGLSALSRPVSPLLELCVTDGQWQWVTFHTCKHPSLAPALAHNDDRQDTETDSNRSGATASVCPCLILHNPSAQPPRNMLLKGEATYFSVRSHPTLSGMSVVHFLAWDVHKSGKIVRRRSVVVSDDLADEVRDIFRDIYLHPQRFPIHEVIGYDYRTVTGGRGLSYHALGRAIDINRAQNPMIKNGRTLVHPDEPPY